MTLTTDELVVLKSLGMPNKDRDKAMKTLCQKELIFCPYDLYFLTPAGERALEEVEERK